MTFINTAGAYPGVGAEERGQGSHARNLMEVMSALQVPIIAIIIGEGGSGGALALAVADKVWMLRKLHARILSPERLCFYFAGRMAAEQWGGRMRKNASARALADRGLLLSLNMTP